MADEEPANNRSSLTTLNADIDCDDAHLSIHELESEIAHDFQSIDIETKNTCNLFW